MNLIHENILEEISEERKYQDDRWGEAFDDKNTLNDWVAYIAMYSSDAARIDSTPYLQRKHLLKAATLCVAAIEAYDRNKCFPARHYDKI